MFIFGYDFAYVGALLVLTINIIIVVMDCYMSGFPACRLPDERYLLA
jgi:hypothetical protein